DAPSGWKGRLRFDHARHRRDVNFQRNYVRLNEWPEWFTVDENTLYRVVDGAGRETIRLGSGLEDCLEGVGSSRWTVEPYVQPHPRPELPPDGVAITPVATAEPAAQTSPAEARQRRRHARDTTSRPRSAARARSLRTPRPCGGRPRGSGVRGRGR